MSGRGPLRRSLWEGVRPSPEDRGRRPSGERTPRRRDKQPSRLGTVFGAGGLDGGLSWSPVDSHGRETDPGGTTDLRETPDRSFLYSDRTRPLGRLSTPKFSPHRSSTAPPIPMPVTTSSLLPTMRSSLFFLELLFFLPPPFVRFP